MIENTATYRAWDFEGYYKTNLRNFKFYQATFRLIGGQNIRPSRRIFKRAAQAVEYGQKVAKRLRNMQTAGSAR